MVAVVAESGRILAPKDALRFKFPSNEYASEEARPQPEAPLERQAVPEPERKYALWSLATFIYPSGEGWIVRSLEVNQRRELHAVEFFGPQEVVLSAIEVRDDAPPASFYRSIYEAGLFLAKTTPTTRSRGRLSSSPDDQKWRHVCICCGHPAHKLGRRVVFGADGAVHEEEIQDRLYCVPLVADFNLVGEVPRKQPGCNASFRVEETLGRQVRTFLPVRWEEDYQWYRAFKVPLK